MFTRIAAAALCLFSLSYQGLAQEPYKPAVPLLELKQAGGKWQWHHGGKPVADTKAIGPLLTAYAAHKDEAAGWRGLGGDAISENPLVVHMEGRAPWGHLRPVIDAMVLAKLPKLVAGTTQQIAKPLGTATAPDTASLPDGYLFHELPRDEGGRVGGVLPEHVELSLKQDADSISYVISIGARGRKVVENSACKPEDLFAPDDGDEILRKKASERRAEVISLVGNALEAYIANSGEKLADAKFTEGLGGNAIPDVEKSAPWVFVEVGALALAMVNAKRISAGKQALRLEMPWQRWPVPEPPLPAPDTVPEEPQPDPEMPGDPPPKGVEFPRPEPFPSGEPKKTPKREDKSPAPKERDWRNDVADNPNPRPDPPTEGKPNKDKPAVGLGGGTSGSKAVAPSPFNHRKPAPDRANQVRVDAALKWLADHQDPEGFWSATNFLAASTRKGATSTGNIEFVKPGEKGSDFGWESITDIGLTGLGLLAFTANGLTHKEGNHKTTTRNAILYLRKVQDRDGCFGPKDEDLFVYNHAIATTAMAEICALTGDPVLKVIVEAAVKFIVEAQNPGLGWRYGVKPAETDSSVTGWMLLALHMAKQSGITIDTTKVHEGAFAWFDKVTTKVEERWRTGYDSPGGNNARLRSAQDYDNNPTMDGIHGAVRLVLGKTEGADAKLADFEKSIGEHPAKWEQAKLDYYYWFWAGMFLQQRSGKVLDPWWQATAEVLTKHQRGWHELDTKAERTTAAKLDEHGSWDAVDAWSPAGGRVYATAMGVLTLSLPWRFAPPTGKAAPENAQPEPPKEK